MQSCMPLLLQMKPHFEEQHPGAISIFYHEVFFPSWTAQQSKGCREGHCGKPSFTQPVGTWSKVPVKVDSYPYRLFPAAPDDHIRLIHCLSRIMLQIEQEARLDKTDSEKVDMNGWMTTLVRPMEMAQDGFRPRVSTKCSQAETLG